jgi:hypothetical protein
VTAALCPYCQGPITEAEESIACSGCETPHHKDCYEENNGCTVFGCKFAPPDEPKLSVSTPDLANPAAAVTAAAVASSTGTAVAAPPPPPGGALGTGSNQGLVYQPPLFSTIGASPEQAPASEPRNRMGFMILGALLGPLGAHNWYAGYYKKAGVQLAITVLTLGFGSPMSWIWAIIDICTIDRDSNGVQFTS